MRETLWRAAQPIGVALAVICIAILFLTFPGRRSDVIIARGLVQVFPTAFGVSLGAAIIGLVVWMKSWKGLAVFVSVAAAAAILISGRASLIPWPRHLDPEAGHTLLRHYVVGSVCAGGTALGIALATGKISGKQTGRESRWTSK